MYCCDITTVKAVTVSIKQQKPLKLHAPEQMFHCDNEAVVSIINKHSTWSGPSMHLVRQLVKVCLQHNILFRE